MSEQQIISEISAHIQQSSGSYRDWYVGIAKNPHDRLFEEHNVHENGDAWIYKKAESSQSARKVESYFLNLGTDGGSGGGDWQTDSVYAYKKNGHTLP